MAKLTPEMKEFIEKGRDPLVWVGTASKSGVPNMSVKGTFIQVVDDETLAYADIYSNKTLDNARQNPNISIAMTNGKTYKGYQFKGKGDIVKSGPLLEAAKKVNPQATSVTRVKVDEIFLMDYGPKAGQKLA